MLTWIVWLACATNSPAVDEATTSPSASPTAHTHFGAPFTVGESVPASVVLADPSAHESGAVRMTGELSQVCQKAGCWAVVKDDDGRAIRVTMKDHAFGIDRDTVGLACDVEGRLVSKPVKQDTLAHYASEGGGDHPEAGQDRAWELVATSVAIAR